MLGSPRDYRVYGSPNLNEDKQNRRLDKNGNGKKILLDSDNGDVQINACPE